MYSDNFTDFVGFSQYAFCKLINGVKFFVLSQKHFTIAHATQSLKASAVASLYNLFNAINALDAFNARRGFMYVHVCIHTRKIRYVS